MELTKSPTSIPISVIVPHWRSFAYFWKKSYDDIYIEMEQIVSINVYTDDGEFIYEPVIINQDGEYIEARTMPNFLGVGRDVSRMLTEIKKLKELAKKKFKL